MGFDKDGKMEISDREKFDAAVESGKVTEFFTKNQGKNYGFTNRLGRISDSAQTNTARYVSGGSFDISESDGLANLFMSTMSSLAKSGNINSGLLLDYLV
jgi:hypothetical protein